MRMAQARVPVPTSGSFAARPALQNPCPARHGVPGQLSLCPPGVARTADSHSFAASESR